MSNPMTDPTPVQRRLLEAIDTHGVSLVKLTSRRPNVIEHRWYWMTPLEVHFRDYTVGAAKRKGLISIADDRLHLTDLGRTFLKKP